MNSNNPIQQRFNLLVEKWTTAINTSKVKIVRIHAEHDEIHFVQDFFNYMLALDTQQQDLVFLSENEWTDQDDFAKELLEELEETIEIWNTAEKPSTFSNAKIEWKPDFSLYDKHNPATLFVQNINKLATLIVPQKDTIVSFILKMPFADATAAEWVEQLLKVPFEEHIRIGIVDADSYPIFKKIANAYPEEIVTLYPKLDLDGAVEEMAAMGNPQVPEDNYRYHMTCLMNGVKQRNEKKVTDNAKKCLNIASANVKKDANWLGQIVVVYTTLYNDQIGYKDYEKALFFADKAVEAGTLSIGRIQSETAYRLAGQTLLGRGTIHRLQNNKEKAATDYYTATLAYEQCHDYLMQIEASRLYAEMADKIGDGDKALATLVKAFSLVDKMPSDTIINSTFPWISKQLYHWSGRKHFISDEQMAEKLIPLFGESWLETINKYGTKEYAEEIATS